MRPDTKRACATTILILLVFTAAGCEHDFYLSENEARAYQSVLATQASANVHFDNLQGRTLNLQFDNSTGVPRVISSNLVDEMRRTELLQLEGGASAVSLDRLRTDLPELLRGDVLERPQERLRRGRRMVLDDQVCAEVRELGDERLALIARGELHEPALDLFDRHRLEDERLFPRLAFTQGVHRELRQLRVAHGATLGKK